MTCRSSHECDQSVGRTSRRRGGGLLVRSCGRANAGHAADEHGGPSWSGSGQGQQRQWRTGRRCHGDRRERRQRGAVHGHHRRAGRLRVRRAPGGQVHRLDRLGRRDRFQASRRGGRRRFETTARHQDGRGERGRSRRGGSPGAAAEDRNARTADQRPGVDHRAVGSRDARAGASRCTWTRPAASRTSRFQASSRP